MLFYFFFLFSSLVSASCSIGATPLEMGAKVKPGTTVEVTWSLYNLGGDRATHITLSKLSGPDWTITYEPSLHVAQYDVSGVIVNKTENLAIENMSLVFIIPENPPNEISYVKNPNGNSYIPVKQIKMYITVPESAKLYQNYGFVFQAKGECFMEPGAVTPAAALQLKVNISTAEDVPFTEKPVPNANGGTGTGFSIFGTGTATSILMITGIIFIMVIFFLLGRGMRKSAKEKTQSGGSGSVGNTQAGDKPQGDDKTMSVNFSSP